MRKLFPLITIILALFGCASPALQSSQRSYGESVQAAFGQISQAQPAGQASNTSFSVKARVLIARDGRVLSATIIQPSGDLAVDKSVQRTLDKVKNVEPFPSDVTDERKTFILTFKLTPKK